MLYDFFPGIRSVDQFVLFSHCWKANSIHFSPCNPKNNSKIIITSYFAFSNKISPDL